MTTVLFYGWLHRFQTYISKTPSRKYLLLLENYSAHGGSQTLPVLQKVEVHILRPNCASKKQPMDAWIIAALKMMYKGMHMERTMNKHYANIQKIYKVDVLTAMTWFKRAWEELPQAVLKIARPTQALSTWERT